MLTVQILINNNENTIKKTLNSILPLECDILVGNLGCKDRTPEICLDYGAIVTPLSLNSNFSKVRNNMIQEGWNLYIEPWEILATGHDKISDIEDDGAYLFQIFKDNIITKQIRLWNNDIKFRNPVYETLDDITATELGCVIYSQSNPNSQKVKDVLDKWTKANPAASEPLYYQAFDSLQSKNYDRFITLAEHYLLLNSTSMSAVIIRYYLAMIELYHKKNTQKSVKNILCCLIVNPIMAEFWCLLGDIYYSSKKYTNAKVYYENAILMGSRRPSKDKWPIEISKYKDYPNSMISNCVKVDKGLLIVAKKPD